MARRRGWAYQAHGDFSSALVEYSEISAKHGDPRADAGMSYVAGRLGKQDVAVAAGRQAIARGLKSAAVFNNTGFSLTRSGQLDLAEQHLRKALALDPTSSIVRFNLASCLWKRTHAASERTPQEALDLVAEAIRLQPQNSSLYVAVAQMTCGGAASDQAKKDVIQYLKKAAELGWDIRHLENDPFIAVVHGAPALLKTEVPVRQDLAAEVRVSRDVSLAREVKRCLARSWQCSVVDLSWRQPSPFGSSLPLQYHKRKRPSSKKSEGRHCF